MADLSQVICLDTDCARAWYHRSRVWAEMNKDSGALSGLKEAILLQPDYAATLAGRENIEQREVKPSNTISVGCDLMDPMDMEDFDALIDRGSYLAKAGDFALAKSDLTQAIHLKPGSSHAWYCRGMMWIERGDMEKAVSDLNESLRIDPTNEDATQARAKALRPDALKSSGPIGIFGSLGGNSESMSAKPVGECRINKTSHYSCGFLQQFCCVS